MKAQPKSIAQRLQEWLDADQPLVGGSGTIYGSDINKIIRVINGTLNNFVIFDNAGGRTFHIWALEDMKGDTIAGFRKFINGRIKGYVYMYKLKGKETVVRELPIYRVQTFEEAYPNLYKKKK